MSVTGVMLAFERQIVTWADRGYRITSPPDGQRLTIDVLLANVESAQTSSPTGIVVRSNPALPVEFNFGRERTLFVNPYTGAIMGERSPRVRAFFTQVENIHRWLGVAAEKRALGESITGACTLAFLALVMSGPFLWWPKEWTWIALKKIILFRQGGNFRATLWNWHNVFGIWCALPLFFIVLTGVIMAYPWANNLLYRMTGNDPPPPPRPRLVARPRGEAHPSSAGPGVLDSLFARAEQQAVGWQSIAANLPMSPMAITFSIDTGSGGPA